MNKTWKKCLTVLTALTLTVSIGLFAGCDNEQALSAYQIAQKHGFTGTEAEWLASLQGAKGEDGKDFSAWELYNQSKDAGEYTGTFVEFLKELGLTLDVQEDNDTQMLAKNTSSVVSICCGFQKETQRIVGSSLWGGAQYVKATAVSGAEGSGVVWKYEENDTTASAYILTNYHVIYQTQQYTDVENGISNCIYVYPYGGVENFTLGDADGDGYLDQDGVMGDPDGIKATFVGGALDYDIAVLKVENSKALKDAGLTPATIGSAEKTVLGEKTYVIGNATGKGISVTGGLVSVLSENIYMKSFDGQNRVLSFRVMRTDAAINSGNSGGAMFNAKGELIGITNAKTASDGVDNMGYALPIDRVIAVAENVLATATDTTVGYLKLARLGIVTTLLSSSSYIENGQILIKEEFHVTEVQDGGIAGASTEDGSRFKTYDTILSGTLNGETVVFEQRYQFQEQLLKIRQGDTITYQVKDRDNVERTVQFTYDDDKYFAVYR